MLHSHRGVAIAASLALLCAFIVVCGADTAAATGDDAKPSVESPVNINTAEAEQLTEIPGVGDATARRIIEWRDEHGPFRRVEDLMKVKGIGETSLEKMRVHVTVGAEE